MLWGDVADSGVDPLTVVVAFDIGEQVTPRGIPIGVFVLVNEFGFEGAEKALHRCIVPAIRLAAHRLSDGGGPPRIARIKQSDITRALRAAQAAGLKIAGYQIDAATGRISVTIWEDGTAKEPVFPRTMRMKLSGINRARMRLADGRVVTYYYAWKGGPRLRGKPGSPEFIASYNEAAAQRAVQPQDVLLSVLQAFQRSQDFLGLAERTRTDYIGKIRLIERKFGDFRSPPCPIAARAACSWPGATGWQQPPAGKPTTPGSCWRAFCHGRSTVG